MQTVDFILETLAHFVKGSEGPAPGIPVHRGSEFERELIFACEADDLAPLVLQSLDKLALDPELSHVTLGRLRRLARSMRETNDRRIRALESLAPAMLSAGLSFAVMGGVFYPLELYAAPSLRSVESIDLLVREGEWTGIVEVLESIGVTQSLREARFSGGEAALRYYQHVSPCIFKDSEGDPVRLRFRIFDVGEPEGEEAAWSRLGELTVGGSGLPRIGLEDLLIQTCTALNMARFDRLIYAVDAGLLLREFVNRLDWDYIVRRLRSRSAYASFYFTLEEIVRRLELPGMPASLPSPGLLRAKIFDFVWKPTDIILDRQRPRNPNPLLFHLFEVGDWREKVSFLRRILFPNSEWVSAFFGRPAGPWFNLKYKILALRNGIGAKQVWAKRVPLSK